MCTGQRQCQAVEIMTSIIDEVVSVVLFTLTSKVIIRHSEAPTHTILQDITSARLLRPYEWSFHMLHTYIPT